MNQLLFSSLLLQKQHRTEGCKVARCAEYLHGVTLSVARGSSTRSHLRWYFNSKTNSVDFSEMDTHTRARTQITNSLDS